MTETGSKLEMKLQQVHHMLMMLEDIPDGVMMKAVHKYMFVISIQ